MWNRFTHYLNFELPDNFTTGETIGLLAFAAALTCLSVVVLHAFIPTPQPVIDVLLHAAIIGLTYTVAFGLLLVMLGVIRRMQRRLKLKIWQVWISSFVTFVAGFYLSPITDWLSSDVKYVLHQDLTPGDTGFHFFRMTPVWALITFVFVMLLQKRSLEAELTTLAEINAALMAPQVKQKQEPIIFASGKRSTHVIPDHITHITVDDHYCAVHLENEKMTRLDVSQPLRELQKLLPDNFMQVHRSNIVNIDKIGSVDRVERAYLARVGSEGISVPVSRTRIEGLLARLRPAGTSGDKR